MQNRSQNSSDSSEVRGSHLPEPTRPTTTRPRNSRLIGKFNLIAAVLVVVALLGGFLLLLSTRQHANNTIGNASSSPPNHTHLYLITAGPNGQTNGVLSALNPSNGQVLWKHQLDNVLSCDCLSIQGNLYLSALDGNVYAFRDRDGQPLWHTSMSYGPLGYTSVWLQTYQNLIIDSITNDNNESGDLYALNRQTGDVVWHTSLSCVKSSPDVCTAGGRLMDLANGIIYGLAGDGLSAWNAGNGHFLWRNPHYHLNGQPQSMVVLLGKVYITNFYPEVDVLDASSGNFLHSLRSPESNNPAGVVYDIAATDNTIYVLGGQSVSAFQASDDSLLWKRAFTYHSGGIIYAGRDHIYVNYQDISFGKGRAGNSGNYLYALSPSDGSQIWQSQVPVSNYLYPVEFSSVICFVGFNGVYGVRISDGKQIWQLPTNVEGLFEG